MITSMLVTLQYYVYVYLHLLDTMVWTIGYGLYGINVVYGSHW